MAYAVALDDRERSSDLGGALDEDVRDTLSLLRDWRVTEAVEHDAFLRSRSGITQDDVAEITVGGQERPSLQDSPREHGDVSHARRFLDDGDNVMPIPPQPGDDRRVNILIRENPHALACRARFAAKLIAATTCSRVRCG